MIPLICVYYFGQVIEYCYFFFVQQDEPIKDITPLQ